MGRVVALALVLIGCGEPNVNDEYMPPAGAGGGDSTGRTPTEARGVDLQASSGQADAPENVCGEGSLAAGFELADEPELPTLHVAASSSDENPDGSAQAPFRKLADAFAEGPATILVAVGDYEDGVIPPGVRVLGGYDADTWTVTEAGVSRLPGAHFLGTGSPEAVSELVNFTVLGDVQIGSQRRVVLRDNVIFPELTPLYPTEPQMDEFSASAVFAEGAFLRADGNQLVLATGDPSVVRSVGFDLQQTCARITKNDVVGYRTPLIAREGELVFNFNFVADAGNGLFLYESVTSATGNYLHLHKPAPGRSYAVYLVDSRPVLRHNEFQLSGLGSCGVNEVTVDSDPLELVGNEFHLQSEARFLYLDRQNDGPITDTQWVNDIGAVNSLADIPVLMDNVASVRP